MRILFCNWSYYITVCKSLFIAAMQFFVHLLLNVAENVVTDEPVQHCVFKYQCKHTHFDDHLSGDLGVKVVLRFSFFCCCRPVHYLCVKYICCIVNDFFRSNEPVVWRRMQKFWEWPPQLWQRFLSNSAKQSLLYFYMYPLFTSYTCAFGFSKNCFCCNFTCIYICCMFLDQLFTHKEQLSSFTCIAYFLTHYYSAVCLI